MPTSGRNPNCVLPPYDALEQQQSVNRLSITRTLLMLLFWGRLADVSVYEANYVVMNKNQKSSLIPFSQMFYLIVTSFADDCQSVFKQKRSAALLAFGGGARQGKSTGMFAAASIKVTAPSHNLCAILWPGLLALLACSRMASSCEKTCT